MKNIVIKMLSKQPCHCDEGGYCEMDNVVYPSHTCENCAELETLGHMRDWKHQMDDDEDPFGNTEEPKQTVPDDDLPF